MPEGLEQQRSILPLKGEGIRLAREDRTLLDIDEIELGQAGVTAIIGHNGAGKSLLLKVLTGLVKPDAGIVTWGGVRPERSAYRRLGYMKQNAVLLRRSAKANLEFALGLGGLARDAARRRADAILREFELETVAGTSARLLSGGEKQRLALARMLAGEPEIILLDEPTASLDPVSTRSIEMEIEKLKADGKPIVLVTHDLRQARCLADDIIFLEHARILAHQSANAFFSEPACKEAADFIGA